ncbi:hypothetical protein [Streptomyces wuyuanensis]|uniref:hypothetical protein n=1 Tax=Streptomyces wuyuanensis TaxID=1196353 RepID=UPI00142F7915|nr:hypothetical protein [Streptomyces wuyuanensis]
MHPQIPGRVPADDIRLAVTGKVTDGEQSVVPVPAGAEAGACAQYVTGVER